MKTYKVHTISDCYTTYTVPAENEQDAIERYENGEYSEEDITDYANETVLETKEDEETTEYIKKRLEYLRGELKGQRISYGELLELHSYIPYIDKGDVELLEASGVPENEENISPFRTTKI